MNRNKIRELITEIELKYPVNRWKHNGYYLWPVLRIRLYMYLVTQGINKRNNPRRKTRYFSSIWSMAKAFVNDLFLRDISGNIYVGAPSHCVTVDGKAYNRYFDPLMDKEESEMLYFSKSYSKKGGYKSERHFQFSNMLMGYKISNKLFHFTPQRSPHIRELCKILQKKGLDTDEFEKIAGSFVRSVDLSLQLSMRLLKKTQPKKVWVLCYYSADVLGLLIAAHKLSIPAIDMQHGGQGKNHLAYNSWNNIPKEGYEALPDYFYTWDDVSAREINRWAEKTEKHTAVQFGNPWVEGWRHGEFEQTPYIWPENLILYTLQPVGEPLEEYLLETIQQTKDEWNWWLRIHPRQMNEKEKIVSRLREYDVLESVTIEEATTLPLPEILNHTAVHITKFSGCALEAYQFGIPTILIDGKGKDIYNNYIQNKDLMYCYLGKKNQELLDKLHTYKKD